MVIVRLSGGLGNQMFQYALGRSLSLKNNVALGLDTSFLLDRTFIPNFTHREYNLGQFNIQASIVSKNQVPFLYRKHFNGMVMRYGDYIRRKFLRTPGREKKPYHFDPSILSLGPNTYLEGWWQSMYYFKEYEEVIKKDFTLKNPSQKIQDFVQEIGSKHSVCVHIRRGDYMHSAAHPVLDEGYYSKALEYIHQRHPIDVVYVFDRDDIEWCKKHIQFPHKTVFVENDISVAETLTLMSACKDFVLANSSLSWWAAWLSDYKEKIIVAPKKWFGTMDNTKDLIPEEWVRI